MLKKKALTAVLTAAFVLGIGGMATDTFSVHEHELGIAHAASPFQDRSITPAKSVATKVAYWRCYWCGKNATTNSYNPGAQVPRAYPPSIDGCPSSHGRGHGWVHYGGVKPMETSRQVLECRYCGKVVTTSKWNGYSRLGCSKNKGGHNWVDTKIVTR